MVLTKDYFVRLNKLLKESHDQSIEFYKIKWSLVEKFRLTGKGSSELKKILENQNKSLDRYVAFSEKILSD